MKRKTLGDEIERLKEELDAADKTIITMRLDLSEREKIIIQLQAENKSTGARERLRVIQEISGKKGEE